MSDDLQALGLTAQLAALTTALLLLLGTPIAWWLARTSSRLKGPVAAVVALPLVLPPTVIGFYLLMLMGPNGPVGQLTQALGWGLLPFTCSPCSRRSRPSGRAPWRWPPPCERVRGTDFSPWCCHWPALAF
jgi:ABC-type molybdate transport system permease subunit